MKSKQSKLAQEIAKRLEKAELNIESYEDILPVVKKVFRVSKFYPAHWVYVGNTPIPANQLKAYSERLQKEFSTAFSLTPTFNTRYLFAEDDKAKVHSAIISGEFTDSDGEVLAYFSITITTNNGVIVVDGE